MSGYSNGAIKLWRVSGDTANFECCGTAYTDSVNRVGSAENASFSADGDRKRAQSAYNSVRSLLLLPSPTLNLKAVGTSHRNLSGDIWRSAEEENVNQLSEDEIEFSGHDELSVKVSPNHVGDGPHRRKRKERTGDGYALGRDQDEFWILSGTSNGSMLLHKLDDNDNDLEQGNFDTYL